jgi:hypothetical protein
LILSVSGLVLAAGAFVSRLTLPSAMIAAAVYLAYGLSRLLSMALDGLPAPGLVWVTGLEIVFGITTVVLFRRLWRSSLAIVDRPPTGEVGSHHNDRPARRVP